MVDIRDHIFKHIVDTYGLDYESTSSGSGLLTYHSVKITGDNTFLGFTQHDNIPFFDLTVNVCNELSFSVNFHRYRCTECGCTDIDGDPNRCCGLTEKIDSTAAPKDIEFNFSINPNNENVATKSTLKTS